MHVKDAPAMCRDGPSQLVSLPEDSIWQLDSSCIDIPWALQELAQQTAAESTIPGHNCCGVFSSAGRPSMPSGDHLLQVPVPHALPHVDCFAAW